MLKNVHKILGVTTEYSIVFTKKFVKRAIAEATDGECHVLHFSSHGDSTGI
ncbi:hypothetical protein [Acetobacter estunensis]|uniref:hypothetical protein n=1 Tax=Acetobacter estunensis TaxID=104097 RepID=UPI001C2D07B3|nr:hypothetical protein [Acetobacter estunensis]MBV1838283.1 hypothetical protein [Acetobacter estunensis]